MQRDNRATIGHFQQSNRNLTHRKTISMTHLFIHNDCTNQTQDCTNDLEERTKLFVITYLLVLLYHI